MLIQDEETSSSLKQKERRKMNFKFTGEPIWYDAEFQSDKPNQYGKEINPLKNDDPVPCDSCPFANECSVSGKECVAFRSWIKNGKSTKTSDLGKYLR